MIRVGVVSLGAPYHGKIFVNNMNSELKHYRFSFLEPTKEYGWAHINPLELDVLWFYGFHALPDLFISKFKDENSKLRVAVDWVGSDILEFLNFLSFRPQCKDCIIKNIDVHVADGLNLVRELESLGIKASYVPSVPEKEFELKPLSQKFSVAAYVPGFRADFFNYPLIKAVAEKMQDVEFHLFGGGPIKLEVDVFNNPNVFYHGWVEGEERRMWWEDTSVLLYMPKHGSLGLIAIEYLQMGRYVICTQEYPHIFRCSSVDELFSTLKQIKDKREPNIEGSKHYLNEYNAEKQAEKVKQILDKL